MLWCVRWKLKIIKRRNVFFYDCYLKYSEITGLFQVFIEEMEKGFFSSVLTDNLQKNIWKSCMLKNAKILKRTSLIHSRIRGLFQNFRQISNFPIKDPFRELKTNSRTIITSYYQQALGHRRVLDPEQGL